MLDLNTPHISYYPKLLIKLVFVLLFSSSLQAGDWAKSSLKEMNLREKIAHLFMAPVWTRGDKQNVDQMEKFLEEFPVGSLIFMQGTIPNQLKALDRLQKKSRLPLLIGQDNEWGLALRLTGSLRFPRNLTLGAISDSSLIYSLGKEVAYQCQGVGVQVNFAPVIDINNNPLNPVINDRSFGENPDKVSEYGLLFMKGLQDHGVMACAKHFPGHGDTHIDSHFSLPIIEKTEDSLYEMEWKPFKALIDQGLQSIMTAHLLFPLLADSFPASLSTNLIQGTLKTDLGFKGLVFTDSLQMKAITSNFEEGDSDLLALIAGNDVIIRFQNFETALNRIEKGVIEGEITESEIDQKVLKILEAKEHFNLHKNRFISDRPDLFSKEALTLKKRLFKEAITLVQNKDALPLATHLPIAFVQIGRDVIMRDSLEIVNAPYEEQCPKGPPPFFKALEDTRSVHFFFLPKKAETKDLHRLQKQLKSYQTVIVGIYEMNKYSRLNFGLLDSTFELLQGLRNSNKKVYLSLFGSPYSLKYFDQEDVILMCYENDEEAQIGAAEILMGKRPAKGNLPVTASVHYPYGFGLIQNLKAF